MKLVLQSLKIVISEIKLTDEDICKLLELIHTGSSKWYDIGLHLGFFMPLFLASAPTSYLIELLRQWIQWPTQDHPTEPTLRALCTALCSSLVGLGSLADKVEKEMSQLIHGKGASHLYCVISDVVCVH